ncbi:hypothetical protein WMY93_027087 [Mugilogobius chulae]|uniref:Uncharacterized protein n=1 Tax=Mugilogobius chulae TaxID=88201 RepID=A0AAW0MYQ8_9GOBI
MAKFLLDREEDFEGVEAMEQGTAGPTTGQRDSSAGGGEEIDVDLYNDIQQSMLEWTNDPTWSPSCEKQDVSSSEEYHTVESEENTDSDENFVPSYRIRTGAALRSKIDVTELQEISEEDTIYDFAVTETPAELVMVPEKSKVAVPRDIIGQHASIVYHKCMLELAQFLLLPSDGCKGRNADSNEECGEKPPFNISISHRGTAMIVKWICQNNHVVWEWNSQPVFKFGMQSGDFMLSTNILLSGNNYSKVALMFKYMNMGMVTKSTYFRIQDEYCVDAIKGYWEDKRAAVIAEINDKGPVVALGDGRMDSPGFSAQYCTYTLLDNDTKKIMSIQQKDKRECRRISTTMEKEAFIHSFKQIRDEVNLAEVCTDAHSQISALFRTGMFKDSGVEHTYDMWHGAKNLGKKIHAAGQQKGCSILLQWAKDICNHFWFCCNKARTYDEFFAMWIGLLHHVTGEHEWSLGACQHDPLQESERSKDWIVKGSPPHKALTEIILKDRWLKEVPKYLKFRSTAHLEGFHNHLLMYASKRFSYVPPVYEARMHLAALDYNHHVHRPVKRNAEGNIQYRKVFNKKSKCWSLYAVKMDKDYSYIPDLQSMIIAERLSSKKGLPRHAKSRPSDPRRLGLLTDVPAPSVQELLLHQRTRGEGQSLPQK